MQDKELLSAGCEDFLNPQLEHLKFLKMLVKADDCCITNRSNFGGNNFGDQLSKCLQEC